MTKSRSLGAILCVTIWALQLGLGASGVFCLSSVPASMLPMASGHHASSMTSASMEVGTLSDGAGAGVIPNIDPSSHKSPEKGVPSHSHGCQAMTACALSMMPTVGVIAPTPLMATGETAIAGRIQVLASMTFPPEPPPPKA